MSASFLFLARVSGADIPNFAVLFDPDKIHRLHAHAAVFDDEKPLMLAHTISSLKKKPYTLSDHPKHHVKDLVG